MKRKAPDQGIAFEFLDVGMGDGTLVEMPPWDGGKIVLVDFGENGSVSKIPSQEATKFLIDEISDICCRRGEKSPVIDHLFITHCDLDHWSLLGNLIDGVSGEKEDLWHSIGGWDEKTRLKINQITIGGNWKDYLSRNKDVADKIYKSVKNKEGFKGLPENCHYEPEKQDGNPFWEYGNYGNKAKIYLLSSNAGTTPNQQSLVLMFEYNGSKVVLTGDADCYVEEEIIGYHSKDNGFLKSIGLKLGHHGSNSSTCKNWVKAVKPMAIFASGDIKWGHPYCGAIKLAAENTKLAQIEYHWYTCSKSSKIDKDNDYYSTKDNLAICTNLWYAVTKPKYEEFCDNRGKKKRMAHGLYTGVQWRLEIDKSGKFEITSPDADPPRNFSRCPEKNTETT